ncbi:MFS transporter, partial [Streptomyces anulatus]|nr:MFS transporter [Streptomyces anulatus]
ALPPGPLPWLLAATAVLAGALLWVRRAAPAKPLPDAVPRTETDGSATMSAHP